MDAPTLENLTKGLNPLATPSVGHTVSPQDLLRWNQLASSLLTDRAGGENRPIFLFYLKIRRGEISSFGSYEAYKDDGEVCSRKATEHYEGVHHIPQHTGARTGSGRNYAGTGYWIYQP